MRSGRWGYRHGSCDVEVAGLRASAPAIPLEASGFASVGGNGGHGPASFACSPCAVRLGSPETSGRPWSPGEEDRTAQTQLQ